MKRSEYTYQQPSRYRKRCCFAQIHGGIHDKDRSTPYVKNEREDDDRCQQTMVKTITRSNHRLISGTQKKAPNRGENERTRFFSQGSALMYLKNPRFHRLPFLPNVLAMAESEPLESGKFYKMGRNLANTEKSVRDEAVETIRRYRIAGCVFLLESAFPPKRRRNWR